MKLVHLTCDWDFKGANLCCNSGIYSSREKAEEVIVNGLDWDYLGRDCFSFGVIHKTLQWLLDNHIVEIGEVILD